MAGARHSGCPAGMCAAAVMTGIIPTGYCGSSQQQCFRPHPPTAIIPDRISIFIRVLDDSAQSSTALPATITSGTETKKPKKACAFKCAVDNLKNVVSIATVLCSSTFPSFPDLSDATRHLFSCDRNSLACLIYCGILLQSSPVDVCLYMYIYLYIHSPHTRNIPSINGSGRNELEWMSNLAASLLYIFRAVPFFSFSCVYF